MGKGSIGIGSKLNHMGRKLFLIGLLLLSICLLRAQDYKTAIGIRGAWFSGISVKHFLKENTALEGFLHGRWRGVGLTGLFELERNTGEPYLNWYCGAGAHISSYNRYYYYRPGNSRYYDGRIFGVGVDGILGLEYTLKDIPLNLALDAHPFFDLIEGGWGFRYDMGLSIRFAIR